MTKTDADNSNMNTSKGKKAPVKKPKTSSTIIPPPSIQPLPKTAASSIYDPNLVILNDERLDKLISGDLSEEEISEIRKFLAREKELHSPIIVPAPSDIANGEQDEIDCENEEVDAEDIDMFMVETENFMGSAVKDVIFPKFLKNTQRVDDKSNLYLALHGEPKVYAQLLKLVASDEPLKPLVIKLYEPNADETALVVAATYSFPSPTLHAIDFGNLSHSREKPREIRIEFNFDHFKIDDVDFFC